MSRITINGATFAGYRLDNRNKSYELRIFANDNAPSAQPAVAKGLVSTTPIRFSERGDVRTESIQITSFADAAQASQRLTTYRAEIWKVSTTNFANPAAATQFVAPFEPCPSFRLILRGESCSWLEVAQDNLRLNAGRNVRGAQANTFPMDVFRTLQPLYIGSPFVVAANRTKPDTLTNAYYYAYDADDAPFLRYNAALSRWEFSDSTGTPQPIGTMAGAAPSSLGGTIDPTANAREQTSANHPNSYYGENSHRLGKPQAWLRIASALSPTGFYLVPAYV